MTDKKPRTRTNSDLSETTLTVPESEATELSGSENELPTPPPFASGSLPTTPAAATTTDPFQPAPPTTNVRRKL